MIRWIKAATQAIGRLADGWRYLVVERWVAPEVAWKMADDWRLWHYHPPPLDDLTLIEIQRPEWPRSQVIKPSDLHPMQDVHGLIWRPWRGETIEAQPVTEP